MRFSEIIQSFRANGFIYYCEMEPEQEGNHRQSGAGDLNHGAK